MENKETFNHELNDSSLEKVNGGSTDWELFSEKVLSQLTETSGFSKEYKEMIEAMKDKDYVLVATLALPLIASDPVLAMIAMECKK